MVWWNHDWTLKWMPHSLQIFVHWLVNHMSRIPHQCYISNMWSLRLHIISYIYLLTYCYFKIFLHQLGLFVVKHQKCLLWIKFWSCFNLTTQKPAASPVKPKAPSSRIGKLQVIFFVFYWIKSLLSWHFNLNSVLRKSFHFPSYIFPARFPGNSFLKQNVCLFFSHSGLKAWQREHGYQNSIHSLLMRFGQTENICWPFPSVSHFALASFPSKLLVSCFSLNDLKNAWI